MQEPRIEIQAETISFQEGKMHRMYRYAFGIFRPLLWAGHWHYTTSSLEGNERKMICILTISVTLNVF